MEIILFISHEASPNAHQENKQPPHADLYFVQIEDNKQEYIVVRIASPFLVKFWRNFVRRMKLKRFYYLCLSNKMFSNISLLFDNANIETLCVIQTSWGGFIYSKIKKTSLKKDAFKKLIYIFLIILSISIVGLSTSSSEDKGN